MKDWKKTNYSKIYKYTYFYSIMLIKTHIVSILLFIMLFISQTSNGMIFALVSFVATFIPDVDTKFSTMGKRKIFRPLQIFVKHRGILHSFTLLFLITLLFALFLPIAALPFFLGYGLHLFLDSFTIDGIAPFYPHKKRISGKIRSGGKVEMLLLAGFIIFDLVLLFFKFLNIY